jgi:hypothetical protein
MNENAQEQQQNEDDREKKPWVTPAATVEQVSDATRVTGGGSTDGGFCHS